jgi:hypothetical protein
MIGAMHGGARHTIVLGDLTTAADKKASTPNLQKAEPDWNPVPDTVIKPPVIGKNLGLIEET